MLSLPSGHPSRRRPTAALWLATALVLFTSAGAFAQGSGRDSTGTGGRHIITGKIFFPSARPAEVAIQVKLQSLSAGELSTIADSNGSFTFSSISPGTYAIIVDAGDDYEIARESVIVDSDLNLPRSGISLSPGTRRYTVMINLQPTHEPRGSTKASVVNAALAEVPEAARTLYQRALEAGKIGDSNRAIDNLRGAISLYPKFPLALNELGVQYLKLGQAGKAIEPLRSATKLSPDAFTPKLNLGVALVQTQSFAEAETQLREALKITSTPTTHMYLGLALAHLRKDEEAEKELNTAIELGGNQLAVAKSHYYLGGLYWRKREYRRAADELETYLRLTPNAPDAERVRATIKELRAKS